MKIILAPYSVKIKSGDNAKNYPYWEELIELLKDHELTQIGVEGEKQLTDKFIKNAPLEELKQLLLDSDLFISVDSFLPHLAHLIGKNGIVLWGQSDPKIFGYNGNTNLLKDRKYLRPDQFGIWEGVVNKRDSFVEPSKVIKSIKNIVPDCSC